MLDIQHFPIHNVRCVETMNGTVPGICLFFSNECTEILDTDWLVVGKGAWRSVFCVLTPDSVVSEGVSAGASCRLCYFISSLK